MFMMTSMILHGISHCCTSCPKVSPKTESYKDEVNSYDHEWLFLPQTLTLTTFFLFSHKISASFLATVPSPTPEAIHAETLSTVHYTAVMIQRRDSG